MVRQEGTEERARRFLPAIERIEDREATGAYRTVVVHTLRGPIETRLYDAPDSVGAGLFAGGAGGDYDSPARDLYPRLCEDLVYQGLTALRVRYRWPQRLDEAVHDVLAGVALLREREIFRVGLVGHSLGGAAVIAAGALAPEVTTVVALATQSTGTEATPELAPRPLLLLHGTADPVLPVASSIRVYESARAPKELRLLDGAGHDLDEAADEVLALVRDWLIDNLVPSSE